MAGRMRLKSWAGLALTLAAGLMAALYSGTYAVGDYELLRTSLLSMENSSDPELLRRERFTKGALDAQLLWAEQPLRVPFTLNEPQSLQVNIKAYFTMMDEKAPVEIAVNGLRAAVLSPAWKGAVEEHRVALPAAALVSGNNTLEISSGARVGYEWLNIKNYTGISKRFPRAYIVFDSAVKGGPLSKPFNYILYPGAFFLLWLIGGNLLARGQVAPSSAFALSCLPLLPAMALLGVAWAYSLATPQAVLLDIGSFHWLIFTPPALFIAWRLAWSSRPLPALLEVWRDGLAAMPGAVRGNGSIWLGSALARYARLSGTAALISFAVLLSSAGALLIFKRQQTAELVADIAYFVLVFGVVARIFEREDGDGKSK